MPQDDPFGLNDPDRTRVARPQPGGRGPVEWAVHSANPVGRRNMTVALARADTYWADATPPE